MSTVNSITFNLDNPRITAILALPVDTVISLKDFITTLLATNAHAKYLFANQIVANTAARLALTDLSPGWIVYQTTGDTFYEYLGTVNEADAGSWTNLATTTNLRTYRNFVDNLSWKIGKDSSLGNTGANATYMMSGWMNPPAPSSAAMLAYGVPLAQNTERTFSGHAKHYYLYSLLGTNILLDLVFEVGSV